jgi:hypothetical protein
LFEEDVAFPKPKAPCAEGFSKSPRSTKLNAVFALFREAFSFSSF